MANRQEFQFINGTSSPMLLVIEPRSSEFCIQSGATVRVLISDTFSGQILDVEHLVGGLVVYTKRGNRIEVFQNGHRLDQNQRTRSMASKLVLSSKPAR